MLIIGLASIVLMAVAMVIDSSAAYLQRQGLDNLADGAALYGADLGAAGVYDEGLPAVRLLQQQGAVREAVRTYLHDTGAQQDYPGITVVVNVDPGGRSVTVTLRAPLDLPLSLPGSPQRASVGASSTAAVLVADP